jgi:hypothetical protein
MSEQHEQKEKVPIWIISFTDMVTLLLAFFAMLQTMAHERSGVLFRAGQGSFIRAIDNFGIPDLLYGQQKVADDYYHKVKYPTDEAKKVAEDSHSRVIDGEADQVRKMFDDLRRMIDTKAGDLPPNPLMVQVMPLEFGDDCQMSPESARQVDDFAANMRQGAPAAGSSVYVVGLARDQEQPRDQLLMSARRAMCVEGRLRKDLSPAELKRPMAIYSFGAGSGQGGDGDALPAKATVVLVVMGAT